MYRAILYNATFLFFLLASLLAQDSLSVPGSVARPVTIDRIVIRGNNVTKDYVILREMSLKPGDTLRLKEVEFDRNRIYSLGLFNRVEFSYEVTDDQATVYVDVNERWYVFPFLVIGVKDRDWKKFYYGLGLLHYNFRGRNEKISGAFALGYDPYVSLRYRNPLLSLESNLFSDIKLFYSRIRNKSLVSQHEGPNFDENHYGLDGTIGKRFDLFRSVSLSLGYQVLTVSENQAGRTLSPSGRDAFLSGTLAFIHDSRDLTEYPSRGTFLWLWIRKNGFGGGPVDYYRATADVRKFIPSGGGIILAARLLGSFVGGGAVPNYGHVYFGYEERIRGHFSEVFEGENLFGVTAEVRVPILPARFFRVKAVPVKEFGLWRFGVYGTIFGDVGKVWYRDEALTLRNQVKGYGAGLNFLLPYSAVLRAEYALNETRRGQFILDISSSF